jgi:ATPase family associated with various cellular activities (AAA)
MIASDLKTISTFSPNLRAIDAGANYWLHQVTIRLRREICWRWHQQAGVTTTALAAVPPVTDPLMTSLDLSRYWQEKCQFYQTEPTAKYLSDQLMDSPPSVDRSARGSFSWVVATLGLNDVSAFVLALGLMSILDHAAAPVIAACLNDATATQPTLALAQQLWDHPDQVIAIADPAHPLWHYGLLHSENSSAAAMNWHRSIEVLPLVANRLLFPDAPLPQILMPIPVFPGEQESSASLRLMAARLKTQAENGLRVVPIQGAIGFSAIDTIQKISQITQRDVVELQYRSTLSGNDAYFKSLITLCWLNGLDIFIRSDNTNVSDHDSHRAYSDLTTLQSIPITIFLEIHHRSALAAIPDRCLLPIVEVPRLSYHDRIQTWQTCLGSSNPDLNRAIAECSRRFRYETATIYTICNGLKELSQPLSETDLIEACRAELNLDIGELAQAVTPRFEATSLVLPPKQQALFQEIYQAMKSLSEVHYGWGTGQAWNECGISVLFAGAPGTGKTIAAEVLAVRLGLPMYRIDLSQVVNKYIGETEKNLKRLFDLADITDTILFFDEADALFGRRTEVKDAHDRYANLEISYLLERMERFKGLAILATNRKQDLDEAFLRRLRYIIDFPLPNVLERKRIWLQVMPDKVDTSQLDFEFLAKQFPLVGGHIRSIVFNACLQTAGNTNYTASDKPNMTMERIMVAIKREYDKLNRSVSPEQFGSYATLIENLEDQ